LPLGTPSAPNLLLRPVTADEQSEKEIGNGSVSEPSTRRSSDV